MGPNPNADVPTSPIQYMPANQFLTVTFPSRRDSGEMVHEAATVLGDLVDVEQEGWAVGIDPETKATFLVTTTKRAVTYAKVSEALSRVAERYRVPGIFWSYGPLRVATANGEARLDA